MSYDHFCVKARAEGYTEEQIEAGNIILTEKDQTYNTLIGDPCYRFKRESKESFFIDRICRGIFLAAVPHLETLVRLKIEKAVLKELKESAEQWSNHF